jgi:MutS-like protein
VLLVAFAALVVVHARLLTAVARADAARVFNVRGLARLGREWGALSEVTPPDWLDADAHPYARDVDVYGHASLATWLGPAATRHGQEWLAKWLLQPADAAIVSERQAAVAELAALPEWRESLAVEGQLATVDRHDLEGFLGWAEETRAAIPHLMTLTAQVLTLAIWTLLILQITGVLGAPWWLIPMLPGVVLSFVFGHTIYAAFDRASLGERVLPRYGSMLTLVIEHAWSSPALARLRARLKGSVDAPAAIHQLARRVEWSELRSAAALLHFPIQAITLWDFHVLFALERWRQRAGAHVREWFDVLGEFDALAVLAAIRHDQPDWCLPTIDPARFTLTASGLGHPLIASERRVCNDVEVGPAGTLLLITGSNMSGKSTLLRAIGLNSVLAQAGAPACASAFAMPPCALQTSIRVQDSLELGLSYFMAALARLKAIVDVAEHPQPDGRVLLYLLDEVLQGTNSAERAIAVRAVARHLLDAGAIGAMTTHDLTLAQEEPLASAARLVHFTEHVHPDGSMTFDYRLLSGLATSSNALRLMRLIGIEPR